MEGTNRDLFPRFFFYHEVDATVVLLGVVFGFLVPLGFVTFSGILLGFWLVQVHVGHVVLVICWVVVLGLSVHVGHVVALVLDVVIGVVGFGLPSAASAWVVKVGAWGVTGCGGRWQPSEMGVDKRPVNQNNNIKEVLNVILRK